MLMMLDPPFETVGIPQPRANLWDGASPIPHISRARSTHIYITYYVKTDLGTL